jgi:hypothetical protein
MDKLIEEVRQAIDEDYRLNIANPGKFMKDTGDKISSLFSGKCCKNCYYWRKGDRLSMGNYDGRCSSINYAKKTSREGKECKKFIPKNSN